MKTIIDFHEKQVLDAVKRGTIIALRRSGAYLRKVARNMVKKGNSASAPGTPPHTKSGRLKSSILFGVDNQSETVVIGPAGNMVGTVMFAHEFGGKYKRQKYPKRPLMGPALEASEPKLSKFWEDSLKK